MVMSGPDIGRCPARHADISRRHGKMAQAESAMAQSKEEVRGNFGEGALAYLLPRIGGLGGGGGGKQ
jgi:hypothetical protein